MKTKVVFAKNSHKPMAPLSGAEIEGCLDSILWTFRAMGAALPILQMDDETLAAHVSDDEGFAHVMQVVKVLLVDRGYARDQAAMRKRILDRIMDFTAERSRDEINGMLKLPINFRLLPEAQSVSADLINSLRP